MRHYAMHHRATRNWMIELRSHASQRVINRGSSTRVIFHRIHRFKNQFLELTKNKKNLKGIILNAEAIHSIDSSAISMLLNLFKDLKEQNISIYIAGAIGPLRDVLFSCGVAKLLGEDSFFVKTHEAVCFFDHKCSPSQMQKKVSRQSTM